MRDSTRRAERELLIKQEECFETLSQDELVELGDRLRDIAIQKASQLDLQINALDVVTVAIDLVKARHRAGPPVVFDSIERAISYCGKAIRNALLVESHKEYVKELRDMGVSPAAVRRYERQVYRTANLPYLHNKNARPPRLGPDAIVLGRELAAIHDDPSSAVPSPEEELLRREDEASISEIVDYLKRRTSGEFQARLLIYLADIDQCTSEFEASERLYLDGSAIEAHTEGRILRKTATKDSSRLRRLLLDYLKTKPGKGRSELQWLLSKWAQLRQRK